MTEPRREAAAWHRLGTGWRWAIAVIAGIVALAAVSALVLRFAPEWIASSDDPEEVGRVRTGLLAMLAGLLAAVGAVYTARTYGLSRQGQITERFTRAIDQLGHKEMDVRLGGIFALERIARDSSEDRGSIVEVLCAYVREHAPWPPKRDSAGDSATNAHHDERATSPRSTSASDMPQPEPRPDTDVQAVLTVLGRRPRGRQPEPRIDLASSDLRGARLAGAHLEEASLDGARLGGAILSDAHLEGAQLNGAKLQEAILTNARLNRARLTGASLYEAKLEGANLSAAKLEGANLYGAELEGANLSAAKLQGAELQGAHLAQAHLEEADLVEAQLFAVSLVEAHLEGADLAGANLEDAALHGAHLEDADLPGAHLEGAKLGGAYLEGARLNDADPRTFLDEIRHRAYGSATYDSETSWPPGFDPDTAGASRTPDDAS